MSSFGNLICSFSELKKNLILISLSVQTYFTNFFGNTVSENKHFAFDIHCEWKPASFRPIYKQWASSSTRFKDELIIKHCYSNYSIIKIFSLIYVHVSWVFSLQTCSDDFFNIFPSFIENTPHSL